METSSKPVQDSYVRSKLSWSRVVLWASLVAVILFVPADRNGCGFFRYGAMEFAHFGYALAWMVIFFALRTRWRLLLLVVTVPVVLFFFGFHGIPEENAGPEDWRLLVCARFKAIFRLTEANISSFQRPYRPPGFRLTARNSISTSMFQATVQAGRWATLFKLRRGVGIAIFT